MNRIGFGVSISTLLMTSALAEVHSVTIHSDPLQASAARGFAIVDGKESLDLRVGRNSVQLDDMSFRVVPTSIEFESSGPGKTRLLELTFAHPEGKGELGGSSRKRALVWNIEAERAGVHLATYRYQVDGLGWRAAYNATVSAAARPCSVRLSGWIELTNGLGKDLQGVRARLVASGDIRLGGRTTDPRSSLEWREELSQARAHGLEPAYELLGPLDLRNGETKYLQVLPWTASINCAVRLTFAAQATPNPEVVLPPYSRTGSSRNVAPAPVVGPDAPARLAAA